MAQLTNQPCPGDWSFNGDDWDQRHSDQFAQLQNEAAKINPSKSLVGALVSFPWADGSAIYRVSKDKPLTLQHVPVHDAWQVPYTQIRGMRRADIVAMVVGDRKLADKAGTVGILGVIHPLVQNRRSIGNSSLPVVLLMALRSAEMTGIIREGVR